jgi:spermidine synthase
MAILLIFTSTLLLSAALLFSVQPMFTKMIIPLLGGSPAVWNTSMVFYQAVLFLGYLYAHFTTKWLNIRSQSILHVIIIAIAIFTLPIAVPQSASYDPANRPVLWLLAVLLVNVGLPFFVISTTAPLLQKWFSYSDHHAAKDPYFLYGASNIGSLGALISYPLIIEPFMTLNTQASAWRGGYFILALLIVFSGALIIKRNPGKSTEAPLKTNGARKTTNGLRLKWVILAFAPSSLLLGVTNYISTDIASVPLLWVIPLALYLLTLAVAFARRRVIPASLVNTVHPYLILTLAALFLLESTFGIWTKLIAHLGAFFVTALMCHGLLASLRPDAEELTEFYIWLSIGGILGGAFNALVAPIVFNSIVEYPLMIALVCLLRPIAANEEKRSAARLYDFALPVIVFLVLTVVAPYLAQSITQESESLIKFPIAAIIIGSAWFLKTRPMRMALTTGAIILAGLVFWNGGGDKLIYRERSFFGVHKVVRHSSGFFNILNHGNTIHGAEFLDPRFKGEPLTYYNPRSAIAEVFAKFKTKSEKRRVAVVGLGAGSLAAYSRPGESWTYYEIDPEVSLIARNPKLFSFLSNSPGAFNIVIGDARLKLKVAPDKAYDIIVLDAFSSDAIPVHLLTKEALSLYTSKLADGGILAFHTSNNYLNLRPVLATLAKSEGLAALTRTGFPTDEERKRYWSPAEWSVMARDVKDLVFLATESKTEGWVLLQDEENAQVWTDDFSNIISILK